MRWFIEDIQEKLQSIQKVLEKPKKMYDSDGNFIKEKIDLFAYPNWLNQAIKTGNFYQEVCKKYDIYFKTKRAIKIDDLEELDE